MSFLTLFHWLPHSYLGLRLRESTWAFAAIEVVHLLALALFGGTVLMVNLRFWGAGLKSEAGLRVVRSLSTQMFGSLAVLVITGALMVVSGPMRYYYNPAFRWKMVLFLAGVLLQVALYVHTVRTEFGNTVWQKLAAALCLSLWLAVALAGRAIGYV